MTSTIDFLKIIVGKRWPLILALFIVELIVVVVVSSSPFFPNEQANYEQQYNSTVPVLNQPAPGQLASIFSNNFRVAIVEMIPAFGLFILGLSLYETARIVQVIGLVKGIPLSAALGTLFFLPSTWLELPAYAIAATEGIYLVYSVYLGFKKGWGTFTRELRFLVINVFLIAGVLVVAATFEVSEIQLETSPDPAAAFLTWIPFVFVLIGVLRFWRRARAEAPALEERDALELTGLAQTQALGPTVLREGVVHYCPSCGKAFGGTPKFCSGCGNPLPQPDSKGSGATSAPAPGNDGVSIA